MPHPAKPRRRTIADGRALIAAWQASGMSARAYCQAHQLGRGRIDFWKRRLRRIDASRQAPVAFIQVPAVAPSRPTTAVMATLPNGVIITIPPGSDLPWVGQVLAVLLPLGAPC